MTETAKPEASELPDVAMRVVGSLPPGVRTHVYDHVYRLIRHAIITRRIPAGTHVVEAALAAQLEVSRTPVRDALRRLETDGLLERAERGGLVVAKLTPGDVEDVFLVRSTLDQSVARLLARRTKPDDWDEARSLARSLDTIARREGTRSFDFATAHADLHAVVYRLAFTPRVATMVSERLLALVEIAGELSYAEAGQETHAMSHVELVEELASGSSRRAVAAAEAHCRDAHLAALRLQDLEARR